MQRNDLYSFLLNSTPLIITLILGVSLSIRNLKRSMTSERQIGRLAYQNKRNFKVVPGGQGE
jgi:hypothetical protein